MQDRVNLPQSPRRRPQSTPAPHPAVPRSVIGNTSPNSPNSPSFRINTSSCESSQDSSTSPSSQSLSPRDPIPHKPRRFSANLFRGSTASWGRSSPSPDSHTSSWSSLSSLSSSPPSRSPRPAPCVIGLPAEIPAHSRDERSYSPSTSASGSPVRHESNKKHLGRSTSPCRYFYFCSMHWLCPQEIQSKTLVSLGSCGTRSGKNGNTFA